MQLVPPKRRAHQLWKEEKDLDPRGGNLKGPVLHGDEQSARRTAVTPSRRSPPMPSGGNHNPY